MNSNRIFRHYVCRFFELLFFITVILFVKDIESLHLKGSWNVHDFYKFLAKFGFQKTDMLDKTNTQGYIYGNITSETLATPDTTLVVVDSEYFLDFYNNRLVKPSYNVCSSMFSKIDKIAWHNPCNTDGKVDFLRKIPCVKNRLCEDEGNPDIVVPGFQFTYAVQDTIQPRFWYTSMVACLQNSSFGKSCEWKSLNSEAILNFDIWFVNGNPFTKHVNPFEHQFSFEMHDVFEIYAIFFILYSVMLPVQFWAFSKQKLMIPSIITVAMSMEYIGIVFNFIHVFKFAFDGWGVTPLHFIGNFIAQMAECLFMLSLLIIVKGWTISHSDLVLKTKVVLFSIWCSYSLANILLFIWNTVEVDYISGIDEWQTWPGYLILSFRIGIMIWFLIELRHTFTLEASEEKAKFHLHFGAGFLVWFIYLPIIAIICTQISTLYRYKTMLSVTYSADFMSYCILLHLLWPGRRSFHIKMDWSQRYSFDKMEFKGLMLRDTSSMFSALSGLSSTGSNDSVNVYELPNDSNSEEISNFQI